MKRRDAASIINASGRRAKAAPILKKHQGPGGWWRIRSGPHDSGSSRAGEFL